MKMEKQAQLAEKIIEAKNYERMSDIRCYVAYSVPMQAYLTVTTMPYTGEWYDSDGIKHGGSI